MIRQPIISILGHVDHGKTTLLDTIRHSTVAEREAGAITQAIGASIVPKETLMRLCGSLLNKLGIDLTIPGLLFIDTPGHAAFTSLRRRGGALADIAILVVDINEGFKPQTLEAIEILRNAKTPFLVAANKIDALNGWKTEQGTFLENLGKQSELTVQLFEKKMYDLVGKFYEMGLAAERFDRVADHTKQFAIVPISAKKGEGIAELLMMVTGLVQKFLKDQILTEVSGPGVGTILEVKEEQGLGKTLDVILYDGSLKIGDTVVIGGIEKPIVTKIKALLEPSPLAEMRDKKAKYSSVKEVHAAIGVKISAKDIEEVVAGMPLRCIGTNSIEEVSEDIQKEVQEVLIETDQDGIILKADTLGSLEAMTKILREKGVAIRKATIGMVTKKDITDVQTNYEKDPMTAVLLGFNVTVAKELEAYMKTVPITIFTNTIIYRLIEEYEKWVDETKKKLIGEEVNQFMLPCRLQLMPNHTFRQNNPAVVGVDIQAGKLKTGTPLMTKQGVQVTTVKSMEFEKENINEVRAPKQLAISLNNVTIGRQISEGDILYTAMPEDHFRKLKDYKQYLSKEEWELLKEIAQIMREKNPVWGV